MVLLFTKIADEISLHTIAKTGRFVNTLEYQESVIRNQKSEGESPRYDS
jgi:hypothetical protein